MSENAHPFAQFRLAQEPRLTQDDLGAKLGVDGMTVSRWERGDHLPRKRLWPKIEEVTGVTPSQLVDHVKLAEPTA